VKVTTWNVNGIRAREAEVLQWIHTERPEILCLQEIKASPDKVPQALCELEGYWCFWHGHKGYSGVSLHVRKDVFPQQPAFFHPSFDHETRAVAVKLGNWVVASLYVPNGGKDFAAKMTFLEALVGWVKQERAEGREVLLCGDLNVALEEKDVHPVMQKPGQVGTTEPERACLRQLIDAGLVDLLRKFDPDNERLFTWWAPWRNFRQKNYGWRIDYVLASGALAASAKSCRSVREFGTSDHGPVVAELEVPPPILTPEKPDGVQAPARSEGPLDGAGQIPLFGPGGPGRDGK
jgi:exodeoxyribonuclease-3